MSRGTAGIVGHASVPRVEPDHRPVVVIVSNDSVWFLARTPFHSTLWRSLPVLPATSWLGTPVGWMRWWLPLMGLGWPLLTPVERVRIWDPVTGSASHTLTGHIGGVRSWVVAQDGSWLASGDYGGEVRIWDPVTGTAGR